MYNKNIKYAPIFRRPAAPPPAKNHFSECFRQLWTFLVFTWKNIFLDVFLKSQLVVASLVVEEFTTEKWLFNVSCKGGIDER